jgi:REP element-mobilizing transposase RayT
MRKHPVHGVLMIPNQPTIVFLTVCTKDRQPWLAVSEVHELLHSVWTEADAWLVGKYTIMPDHIHMFIAPGRRGIPIGNWVRYWKSQFTRRHRNPCHLWEADYWDTRLRRSESYIEKWEYVSNNPVRRGLVKRPKDWIFQGEIHNLYW